MATEFFWKLNDHANAALSAASRARRAFYYARDNGLDIDREACTKALEEMAGALAANNVANFYANQHAAFKPIPICAVSPVGHIYAPLDDTCVHCGVPMPARTDIVRGY